MHPQNCEMVYPVRLLSPRRESISFQNSNQLPEILVAGAAREISHHLDDLALTLCQGALAGTYGPVRFSRAGYRAADTSTV
jgi:hypothetical protein